MGAFRPVVLAFKGRREITVTTLAEASSALDRLGWTDDDAPELMQAAKLVDDAMQGRCAPRVAFDAFVSVATAQGMVKTAAQGDLDPDVLSPAMPMRRSS